jgi:4'-phosphopantetheinyl transferase
MLNWQIPPIPLDPPASDCLHIWLITLSGEADSFLAILSPDEKDRAGRIRHQASRNRFCIARGAVRMILGDYLDTPPGDIRFRYGHMGKPEMIYPQAGIRFNLSHSDDLALLVLASGQDVGIDLEPVRERENLLGIAKRIFDDSTFKEFSALPNKNLVYEFKRRWTALEARAKAKGISLFNKTDAGDTDCINFEPLPGWMAAVAATATLPDTGQWGCYRFTRKK